MFYNKEIEIWTKGIKDKNTIGLVVCKKPEWIKTNMVDMQPYSSEEAKKDYGSTIECSKRMFCDIEDININTNIIKYNNKSYEITKIIEWDDYLEVMLNEI
ncbi:MULTISPECIES: hypothetical protein [Clostridium]|uniref:hypothetical protein n=1 Tax=Clostridium TaxID=1485 RepID=UPI000DFB1B9A|nr:hypothetical protein [Clostridium sporogenes]MCW6085577.1 hypothetical protein [Clostridium sporogenes]STC76660.1 Uncharacterised protein [Clostridium botulinum]